MIRDNTGEAIVSGDEEPRDTLGERIVGLREVVRPLAHFFASRTARHIERVRWWKVGHGREQVCAAPENTAGLCRRSLPLNHLIKWVSLSPFVGSPPLLTDPGHTISTQVGYATTAASSPSCPLHARLRLPVVARAVVSHGARSRASSAHIALGTPTAGQGVRPQLHTR